MYLEISDPMDYHAALYIRLSKEDEKEGEREGPSQSVQNQESLLREFVQQHCLSVYDTYIDDGWSGTNFDRPAFQRMIADIEAKKVNMVKVRMLVNSRRHTRSRTYDFLLKGLVFCHECGYPLAVLNRKNAKGEDVLYFVCRTYQRFTKAGVCTCHSIKEKTVTDAVIAKVREVCQAYLNPDELLPVAQEAVENTRKQSSLEMELQNLQSKIDSLTANLDRMYTDRLSGLLPEADFQRIFGRIKLERKQLEEKRQALEFQKKSPVRSEDRAKELVQRFIETAGESRELLVSLIERVELTEDKEVMIKFRFNQLDEAAESRTPQGIAPPETA